MVVSRCSRSGSSPPASSGEMQRSQLLRSSQESAPAAPRARSRARSAAASRPAAARGSGRPPVRPRAPPGLWSRTARSSPRRYLPWPRSPPAAPARRAPSPLRSGARAGCPWSCSRRRADPERPTASAAADPRPAAAARPAGLRAGRQPPLLTRHGRQRRDKKNDAQSNDRAVSTRHLTLLRCRERSWCNTAFNPSDVNHAAEKPAPDDDVVTPGRGILRRAMRRACSFVD